MLNYFKEIFVGIKSLLIGMKVTAFYGTKRTITAHYPFEKIPVTLNFRGHIDLVVTKKGYHKCITCGMCERACPSGCITLDSVKPEGAKKKKLTGYTLDFTKCSLCGNCVETCPTNAIKYSNDYYLVGTSRHDFHFDLLDRAMKAAEEMGIEWTEPVEKPKEPKEPQAEGGESPSPAGA
ncbi:MAG: NADH-quinone oxidoreductase subunit I [Deltaproteobacteria bacterium]|nr:MAG: NADH-quinone oxidoreductase subunit I [Deltaproteobacteria bacterium]